MNKFEQLIEYVINDEEAKARELFHEIVVEKSRAIYEDMMDEESEEEIEESAEEELEESAEEELEEAMGGDQVDDLIDDVEVEEEGLSMEAEEDMDDSADHHDDAGGDEDLEDRVIDLEDKVDELMAQFEKELSGDHEDEIDMDLEVTDTPDMSPEEVVDDELETEGMRMPMEEAVDLKAAPKPVTSEEGSINKKSTVASNSGARGAMAKPVHMGDHEEKGRPAPQAKDMGSTTVPNVKPATKPHLTQATGVNTKSVIE